ncbi:MAG: VOC family protein [Candidatus Sumerlaeia bacterium]|nr:VOC family protein [Candidatus Sumerlaeia bacterium]
MINHIDHINIVVRDLEKNVEFYRDVLGFRVTMEALLEGEWIDAVVGLKGVRARCVYLQPENGPRLELLQYESPVGVEVPRQGAANTQGYRHVAFLVDDIEVEYERLCARGVKFLGPPVTVPLQSVKTLTGRKRLCYFHGPEDVLLEICDYRKE